MLLREANLAGTEKPSGLRGDRVSTPQRRASTASYPLHELGRSIFELLAPAERDRRSVALRVVGIVVAVALLIGPIALSSRSWASSSGRLLHNRFWDGLYYALDPLVLYILSGYTTFFLLFSPRDGQSFRDQPFRYRPLRWAGVSFFAVSGVLFLIQIGLKDGFSKARPLATKEHTVIAAYLEGWLPETDAAELRRHSQLFECPVGRVVFGQPDLKTARAAIERLVAAGAPTRDETLNHISTIHRRVGIVPASVDLRTTVAQLPTIQRWRSTARSPFFMNMLRIYRMTCDLRQGTPSGFVLAQSFILAVFFLMTYSRLGFSGAGWSLGWVALATFQFFAWIACAWSRLYEYEHTCSDLMWSFALTVGFVSIVRLGQLSRSAGQRRIQRVLALSGVNDLLPSLKVLAMAIDADEKITVWNREAERITGYSHSEVPTLQEYARKLYGHEHAEAVLARKRRGIREGIEEKNLISLITTKSGSKKLILWNSAIITDDDGTRLGKFAIGHEISRSERRFIDIGIGATTLMHELQHKLELIKVQLDAASSGGAMLLDPIITMCDEIRHYVRGDDSATLNMAAPMALINYVMKAAHKDAWAAGVTVRSHVPKNIPAIAGNEYVLRHAVTDLVRNAIRAAATDKTDKIERRVTISVTQAVKLNSDYIQIEVADNGPGLSDDLKAWISSGPIFDSASDEEREVGLGLLLANMIAREQGGWLFWDCRYGQNIIGLAMPALSELVTKALSSEIAHTG